MPRKTLAYNKESLQNSAFVVLCCEPLLKDILRFHSQGEEHKEQKAPDRLH